MEGIKYRELGKVRNIVEAMGIDITHVHEDIVFVEHTAFILRFDDECDSNLMLHFNVECEKAEKKGIMSKANAAAGIEGYTITQDKDFKLEEVEGKEEVRLVFI